LADEIFWHNAKRRWRIASETAISLNALKTAFEEKLKRIATARLGLPTGRREVKEGLMGLLWIELLIAGVVSLGAIVVVRAIITALSIARRPPYDAGHQSSISPIPPEAQPPGPE
jgi:hypothetical protein